MTERLYFTDAYQRTFTGTVIAVGEIDGNPTVQLDRTAFYPTSGGQPYDTGTLAGYAVVDVTSAADGVIQHHLAPRALPLTKTTATTDARQGKGPVEIPKEEISKDVYPLEISMLASLVGSMVEGEITWPRRYDHMQQHSGQHLLSQVFFHQFGYETASVHFGAVESTVDLAVADLSAAELAEAERVANDLIYAALPIQSYFVTDAELGQLPLRKAPKVSGKIRIVEIDHFDYSACGGTHCHTTAEIGPLKCTRFERRRGQVRITFLAGMRAYRDYAAKHELLSTAANLFSNEVAQVPALIERNLAQLKEMQRTVDTLQEQLLHYETEAFLQGAEAHGNLRLIEGIFTDKDLNTAKRLAIQLQQQDNVVILFAVVEGEKVTFCFGCDPNCSLHMGHLLRSTLDAFGGKGGGKADFAQGGGIARAQVADAMAVAKKALLAA